MSRSNERARRSSVAHAPIMHSGQGGRRGRQLLELCTRLGRAAKARAGNNWDKVTVSVLKARLPFLRLIRPAMRQSSSEKGGRDDRSVRKSHTSSSLRILINYWRLRSNKIEKYIRGINERGNTSI